MSQINDKQLPHLDHLAKMPNVWLALIRDFLEVPGDVVQDKLLELDNIITRSQIYQSKFDREVDKIKRAISDVPPHIAKKMDAEGFLEKLNSIDGLREKSLELQTKGAEVSKMCWAMESIDVKVFKKLQEVCSSVSGVFNLLEHEFIPLENIFSELSGKIKTHKTLAHF